MVLSQNLDKIILVQSVVKRHLAAKEATKQRLITEELERQNALRAIELARKEALDKLRQAEELERKKAADQAQFYKDHEKDASKIQREII